jgi:plastocyanin
MRRPLALGLALGSLALLSAAGASSQLGAPHARAAQTWSVQVGADIGGGPVSGNWFFPNVVTINVGDTVSWTFPSVEPHGVAFDNGHEPTLFDQGLVPQPNGDVDLTQGFIPHPGPTPPTTFDPTAQLGSGVPTDPPDQRQPFTLTFNTAGVFAYDCPVHGPPMSGTIIVQPAGSQLSETPDKEKARGQADLAAATAAAQGGPPPFAQPGPVALASGATLYPVTAGAQVTNGVDILQFLGGQNITVHQGDVITFTGADPSEIHTVTLTSGAAPPDLIDVRPQPAGPPQIVIPALVAQPSGGNVYDGTGYLNSGILFPGSTFTLTVNAPPGTYEYICLLHGGAPQNMKGTITVQ